MIHIIQDVAWSSGYKWATLDMAVLYLNIPHQNGVNSIRKYLQFDGTIPEVQKQFIMDSIYFILQHKVFCFDDQL